MATPAFLPGEFHRQRSLESYSSQGFKESDMTERLMLIADNVLITAVQQSDSVIHLYIYIIDIYIFFSIMIYHRILNTVLCVLQ